MCVAEYERYSDDPWATVAVVKYVYLYVFCPYTYIYISFDNSDDVIRLGLHLNICIIYFPHCYIF